MLKSKEEWLLLRKLRNDLSHEYVNESEGNALSLNLVYENTEKLYDIFMQVKSYVNDNLFTPIDDFVLETLPMKNASNSTRNTDH
ncbi:MAG: hypothetical protein DRR00_31225 [Candidatus Parabeggiatoa sp. nov. 3]|nr:MAG: hypothetical protein DRR00_31225 [Gammaproteobacteria bacterium]